MNHVKTVIIINTLYSFVNLRAAVNIGDKQMSTLINNETKINLIKKKTLKQLNVSYTVNERLQLININEQKMILHEIMKNIKIKINLMKIIQSLLIMK